jgi:GT2 family glycosyltransferase
MRSQTASIVVPTIGRPESLARLLRALDLQRDVDGAFDAVVVSDGPLSRETRAILETHRRFQVQVAELEPSGPAAARNRGAAVAQGDVLIFLDDDIEPTPGVVRAHLAFHQSVPDAIGLGDLIQVTAGGGFFETALRGWLDAMVEERRESGHRYGYRDLLSGHFSMTARNFAALGGFDALLRCHEDYELGYRAIAARMDLCLVTGAIAYHRDTSNLDKALRRKFDEGMADVHLVLRYPELAPTLPLGRALPLTRVARLLSRMAWTEARRAETIARSMERLLPVYEAARLRFRWRALLEQLLVFWYWRGVAAALPGGRKTLPAPVAQSAEGELVATIDLAAGLEDAARQLDRLRPRSLRLVYGPEAIGHVPYVAGLEPLRGRHLRRILAKQCAPGYLRAAAGQHGIPDAMASCVSVPGGSAHAAGSVRNRSVPVTA